MPPAPVSDTSQHQRSYRQTAQNAPFCRTNISEVRKFFATPPLDVNTQYDWLCKDLDGATYEDTFRLARTMQCPQSGAGFVAALALATTALKEIDSAGGVPRIAELLLSLKTALRVLMRSESLPAQVRALPDLASLPTAYRIWLVPVSQYHPRTDASRVYQVLGLLLLLWHHGHDRDIPNWLGQGCITLALSGTSRREGADAWRAAAREFRPCESVVAKLIREPHMSRVRRHEKLTPWRH